MTMADSQFGDGHDNSVRQKAGIKEEKEMKKITMKMVGVGLASVFAAVTAVQAADVSAGWKNDVDGNWSVAGNWTGSSGAPTGTAGVATFNVAITADRTVTLDASPWTVNKLVFTNNSTGNAYGWTLSGGTLNLALNGTTFPTLAVNGVASKATVSSALSGADFVKDGAGTLVLSGASSVGVSNVTGRGTLVLNGGTMTNVGRAEVGIAASAPGNTMMISNGAVWNLNGKLLTLGYYASSNQFIISASVVTNVAQSNWGLYDASGPGNMVVVTNGGKLYTSNISVGNSVSKGANSVLVSGIGSLWNVGGGYVKLGDNGSVSNSLTVTDGGMVTNLTLYIGSGQEKYKNGYNSVSVSKGGKLYSGAIGLGSPLSIGSLEIAEAGYVSAPVTVGSWSSTNNMLTVLSGGVLQTSAITVGSAGGTGNVASVSGGILQFTSATPTITVGAGAGNAIIMTSGTLSYRNVNTGNALLTENQGATYSGTFTWKGENRFRLNNATNTATGAYTFEATADPRNYVGLELVDGFTRIDAAPLTVGATGSILFSNTTARVSGLCTNSGAMTLAGASVTFQGSLALGGGSCTINVLSTNRLPVTVSGTLALNGGALINVPAGLGRTDSFTLFSSPNAISGSVASMAVSSPAHRVTLGDGGKTLLVRPKGAGTMVTFF